MIKTTLIIYYSTFCPVLRHFPLSSLLDNLFQKTLNLSPSQLLLCNKYKCQTSFLARTAFAYLYLYQEYSRAHLAVCLGTFWYSREFPSVVVSVKRAAIHVKRTVINHKTRVCQPIQRSKLQCAIATLDIWRMVPKLTQSSRNHNITLGFRLDLKT